MSQSHSLNLDLSESNIRLGSAALSTQAAAGIIGLCGMVASAVIGFTGAFDVDHSFFMKSWLQNYIFVLSIALGAFFFVFYPAPYACRLERNDSSPGRSHRCESAVGVGGDDSTRGALDCRGIQWTWCSWCSWCSSWRRVGAWNPLSLGGSRSHEGAQP